MKLITQLFLAIFVPGSYSKNPYEFRRSWTVNTLSRPEVSREELLEQELKDLKQQIAEIQQKFLSAESEDRPGPSRRKDSGLLGPLRSSLLQRESDDESDHPPSYSSHESADNSLGGSKTVHITNVVLTLNGIPLDMLETDEGMASN